MKQQLIWGKNPHPAPYTANNSDEMQTQSQGSLNVLSIDYRSQNQGTFGHDIEECIM